MLKSAVRRQTAVIEYHDGDWWTMLDDGSIQVFGSPEAALKAVRKAATRGNKTATVTRIEWRDAPEGFTPPK